MYKNREISRNDYNIFRNRLNKEIDVKKKQYFQKLFLDSKNDMKKSWKTLRSLMGTDGKNKSASFISENNNSDENFEILNKFNDFFAKIGHSLADQVPNSDLDACSYIDANPQSFFLYPVSPAEINSLILKLKNTKTQIDELPVYIFKKIVTSIEYPLSFIINTSYLQGVFPEKLKTARITPIHKNGDNITPSNFRPISSLHYISKIYEKTVSDRMMSFCSRCSLISHEQFGFQAGVSTCHALIRLTEILYQALNENKFNFTLLIDIRKAFDCVDHSILISKLQKYGIRGLPLSWFRSYLKNRKCFIEYSDIKSNINVFNTGVPQGSILGPLLFLLFINDLPKISNNIKMILFADDTTLTISDSNLTNLVNRSNIELNSINNWVNANKLTLNTDKTEFLITSNRTVASNINIEFQSASIVPSNSCKYLGVMIDNKLCFRDHIHFVISKISKHTGILYKLKDSLPMCTRLNYYFAFMHPYISYNIIVWGSTYHTILEPLNIQMKRIVRIICGAKFRDHTNPLFKKLRLLKLYDLYKYHTLIHVYKQKSLGLLEIAENLHNTRHHENIRSQYHRLDLCQHALSFMGPKIWNSLPHNIQAIRGISAFKRAVK